MAVHARGARQETPVRLAPGEGLGTVSRCHAVPFHRSAIAPLSEPPTAMQRVVVVQLIEGRLAKPTPAGLTVCWTDHVWPFQCSAIGRTTPEAKCCSPTAVHQSAARQSIPPR